MSLQLAKIIRKFILINNLKLNSFLISLILTVALQPVLGQSENKEPSAYLFPEFSNGKILLKAGTSSVRMINYNILTEEMIFEYQGKYLAVANVEYVDTVYIQTRKFISVGKLFYEIPALLKVPLIIQHQARVIAPGTDSGYGGTSEISSTKEIGRLYGSGQSYAMKLPSNYRVIPFLQFFVLKDGLPVRISNVKQVIKCFPAKEDEIRKYVKEHKTDFSNQENMVDLVTFCNQ